MYPFVKCNFHEYKLKKWNLTIKPQRNWGKRQNKPATTTKKGKIPDQNVAKKFLKSQLLACILIWLSNLALLNGTGFFHKPCEVAQVQEGFGLIMHIHKAFILNKILINKISKNMLSAVRKFK